jgi:hypothetical protein
MPEQVQDFYPTPGTVSTVMYATGIDPLSGKKIPVVRDYHEKQLCRALLQYGRPQNALLVREALVRVGREDLIGYGPECLVRPERGTQAPQKRPGKSGTRQAKLTANGGKKGKSKPNTGIQYNGAGRKKAATAKPTKGHAPARKTVPKKGKVGR